MAKHSGCNAPGASGVELLRRATSVELSHSDPGSFSLLLQGGFYALVESGTLLKDVLRDNLGIPNDCSLSKIRSVYFNGSRLSAIDTTPVVEDSRLSLSSSGGRFFGSVLRGRRKKKNAGNGSFKRISAKGQAILQVHLLQATAGELADCVLKRGVYVGREKLMAFLSLRPQSFFDGLKAARLDGYTVSVKQANLGEWLMCTHFVRLSLPENDSAEVAAA